MYFKAIIKRYIPSVVLSPLQRVHGMVVSHRRRYLERKLIDEAPSLHRKAVQRIRDKEGPINVVFFALMESVWKYDRLYRLMAQDSSFNPTILICPVVNYGRENMLRNIEECYELFRSRGYNVLKAYDESRNEYVDVRKELSPDIIFYTNPYEGLIDDRYFIKNFCDILTCYTPYGIGESKRLDIKFDSILPNLLWKFYVESAYMANMSRKYARARGRNVVYSGYPGTDRFIDKEIKVVDVWKNKDKKIKRIIWSPHHTISDYAFVSYSTFLEYHEFMLDMADKYRNKIQIAFKPHPLLRNRLELVWGKERTREYYEKWTSLNNGMLCEGEYEDLFMSSDAIIHDCGSFIGEYLYTCKPAMFLSNGRPFADQYNEFAQKCLDNYYIGNNQEDIEGFIVNVINEVDDLREKRSQFFKNELLPPNDKFASENIIEDLIKELRPDKSNGWEN